MLISEPISAHQIHRSAEKYQFLALCLDLNRNLFALWITQDLSTVLSVLYLQLQYIAEFPTALESADTAQLC